MRRHGLLILTLVAVLALTDEADARVGGGQGFGSGGGSRGGGGYSGGGGGGGEADILFFVIRLCIAYPEIGIPLLIMFVIAMFIRMAADSYLQGPKVYEGDSATELGTSPGSSGFRGDAASVPAQLKQLRQDDPGFSRPVFEEWAQLVVRRAYDAIGGDASALGPFWSADAQAELTKRLYDVTAISEVVQAGVSLVSLKHEGRYWTVVLDLAGSRTEHLASGSRHVYFEERWVFRRPDHLVSVPPADMMALGCPSCGATVETNPKGECTHCGTVVTKGTLQWQAVSTTLTQHRELAAPATQPDSGGTERSVSFPTVMAPDLSPQLRGLHARHGDFDVVRFRERVRHVYSEIQAAWSDADWQRARPHVSDTMFRNLSFWMRQYADNGLVNKLEDVSLTRDPELVKVETDAWYEAITVRIYGSIKDSVHKDGTLIGGNATVPRRFSEYWTFLRSAGTGGGTSEPGRCPSCGAGLDKVNQSGICEYCDAHITSGDFDWVLSRIEQPEVYRG